MKIIRSFPHSVRCIEHLSIPLPDGCRLAARMWLPEGAESSPVPAILEYIPYGKRDGTRERDEPMHHYFAGHGYAALRVDLRGSGESDGLLLDEYLTQEHDDGLEVLRWIAAQPWCDGSVGMIGKSWGGFNALQIAARRPPELRAVISVCSTDDRYADDAHYMGGCLLNENQVWGSVLFTLVAQPPDPALVGEGWRRSWLERLENLVPFPALWLRHPLRDAYWRHGSVCEDFSQIACPVYAVGGWADAYSNAIPRLLAGLRVPCKGLVGPWGHLYPHEGVPGPAIGFLQEALRWWERWLRGVDNGIEREPAYRVWMQESVAPGPAGGERPGRWVAEPVWPSPRIEARRWSLADGRLQAPGPALKDAPAEEAPLSVRSPQTTGLAAGRWCSFGGGMPGDQREDDAGSLVFDSAPLSERLEILGAPVVTLALAVDRPAAFVVARLCEVAPDGASLRVSYGLLDLAHREGHERLAAVRPGERMTVQLQLNDVAHAFPAGHRLRLALSTCYWPMVWPAPEPVKLSVFGGASGLELPVRTAWEGDARLAPFAEPEGAPRPRHTQLGTSRSERRVERDPATGETLCVHSMGFDVEGREALSRFDEIGLEGGETLVERFRIVEGSPLSARAELLHSTLARRAGWEVRVATRTRLTATATAFRLQAEVSAHEGSKLVFERAWDERIPRDGA